MVAISNTSPLLYLYRAGGLEWLPQLFGQIWAPTAVTAELETGMKRGYEVPIAAHYEWLRIVDPKNVPSQWLSLDLGAGELAALALALENPTHLVLLDDLLARRTGQAAGLTVWGTLRIVLEAKSHKLIDQAEPIVTQLQRSGMWISPQVKQRILALAKEI